MEKQNGAEAPFCGSIAESFSVRFAFRSARSPTRRQASRPRVVFPISRSCRRRRRFRCFRRRFGDGRRFGFGLHPAGDERQKRRQHEKLRKKAQGASSRFRAIHQVGCRLSVLEYHYSAPSAKKQTFCPRLPFFLWKVADAGGLFLRAGRKTKARRSFDRLAFVDCPLKNRIRESVETRSVCETRTAKQFKHSVD